MNQIKPDDFGHNEGTTVWWLGAAGFMINCRGIIVFIDPTLSMTSDKDPSQSEAGRLLKPLCIQAKDVPCVDLVLYTHGDVDHFGQKTALTFAEKGCRRFCGPPPVMKELESLNIPSSSIIAARYWEEVLTNLGFVSTYVTPADHGFPVMEGGKWDPFTPCWKRGDCCGYIITTPEGSIWHTGDTKVTYELLSVKGIDLFLLIADEDPWHHTYRGGARLAKSCGARHIIPYHYGTHEWFNEKRLILDRYVIPPNDPQAIIQYLEEPERYHILEPGTPFRLSS